MIDLCERYFRTLDAIIERAGRARRGGRDASCSPPDHGFGPTRDVFHVNSWLEREGYLAWAQAEDGAAGRRRPRSASPR